MQKNQEPRNKNQEKRRREKRRMPKTPSSKFQIPGSNGKQETKKIKKHSCISGYLKNQESRNKRR
jgi:hypothetical protein